jgi:hypothetical protein
LHEIAGTHPADCAEQAKKRAKQGTNHALGSKNSVLRELLRFAVTILQQIKNSPLRKTNESNGFRLPHAPQIAEKWEVLAIAQAA